jgi:hypothetical protein
LRSSRTRTVPRRAARTTDRAPAAATHPWSAAPFQRCGCSSAYPSAFLKGRLNTGRKPLRRYRGVDRHTAVRALSVTAPTYRAYDRTESTPRRPASASVGEH